MILSTLLRVTRGTKKAIVDIVKNGQKRRTKSKESAKEKQNMENRTVSSKVTSKLKKSGKSVIKQVKGLTSELFLLGVEVLEDSLVALFVGLLALMILLSTIIPVIATSVVGVINGASNLSSGGTSTSRRGGVKITDPSTYDWWGNRDKNRLLLTDQWEKDLYDLVAISYALEQYTRKKDGELCWRGNIGAGTTELECGTPVSSNLNYNTRGINLQDEKDKAGKNLGTYLFKDHMCGYASDSFGDGPVGMSFEHVGTVKPPYDFSYFKSSDISQSEYDLLRQSIRNCPHQSVSKWASLSNEELYGIYSLPGTFFLSYEKVFKGDLLDIGYFKSYALEALHGYGLVKDINNLTSEENELLGQMLTGSYYEKHHGCNKESVKHTMEILACMLAYADNHKFDTYIIKPSSGDHLQKSDVAGLRGHFLSWVAHANDEVTLQVLHDGKTVTINNFVKQLGEFATSKGRGTQWYSIQGYAGTDAYYFNVNPASCLLSITLGNSYVQLLIDELGLVFEEESVDNDNWAGGTKTAQNVVAVMEKLYQEHGTNSSDPWTYGHNDLLDAFGSPVKNFNDHWCAMFVNTVLNKAKINGSNMSVAQGLQSQTNKVFPTGATADMGYCTTNSSRNDSIMKGSSGNSEQSVITKSGFVTAHYGGDIPWASNKTPTKDYKGQLYKESKYTPKAGDIITYYNNESAYCHVGLVCEDGKSFNDAMTIEGNTVSEKHSSCINKKNGAQGRTSVYFEINYAALESTYGVPSNTSSSSGSLDIDKYVTIQAKTLGNDNSLNGCSQVLDVVVSGTSAKLTVYNKSGNKWQKGGLVDADAFIGREGLATRDNNANENKSQTPWGIHYLGVNFGGFGVAYNPKINWKNVSSTQSWWGSSRNTKHLNQFYQSASAETGADENLTSICNSGLYKYSILIEYNYGSNAKNGGGSAFFLHVGSSPTAGCVATSEANMKKIVDWIDKSKKTKIMLHTEDSKVIKAATVVKTTGKTSTQTSTRTSTQTSSKPTNGGNTSIRPLNYPVSKIKNWGRVSSTTSFLPDDVKTFCKQLASSGVCESYVLNGVSITQNGSFTYYGEDVLPGPGLVIPGRTHADGFVVDGDGYIVVAGSQNQKANHTIVPTPFAGRYGKVYDVCDGPSFDLYTQYTN